MSQGAFFPSHLRVSNLKSHCILLLCLLHVFPSSFALPPFRLILSFIRDGWITGGTVILLCPQKL